MNIIQVLRAKKLKGNGIIAGAARHNLREIQAEIGADSHIDSLKSSSNIILRGAARAIAVASEAADLMKAARVKPIRKDAVRGLEIVFSLPPVSGIAEKKFFTDAVTWAEGYFEIPILSAIIHNDEAAPHCHLIMLPLFGGRMIGSALIGYKSRLQAMQADFHAKVGQGYGLERQSTKKRYSAVARAKASAMVVAAIRKKPTHLCNPMVSDALREAMKGNPIPAIEALGLEMPKTKPKKKKTFAGIMTKRFKPEKYRL